VLSTPPLATLLASWYVREVPRDPALLREGIADLVRMDVRAHLASLAAIGDSALIASLEHIATPTLLITGRDDRVMPPEALAAAARLLPNSSVVLLERCGHLPMLEAPVAYHAALRTFLDD
jgi:abhydrolase domain-containing protein 6